MQPSRDHDALLAAAGLPGDDVPRLLLADWLEENGEPDRAELIRLGCRLARLPADDPGWPELARRERGLRRRVVEGWLVPLAGPAAEWHLDRGLPDRVSVPVHAFLAAHEAVLATGVREVRLFAPAEGRVDAAALAACPGLARVSALDLQGHYLGPDVALALSASPLLAGLRELRLGNNVLGPEGVEALALCPALAGLEALGLGGNLLGDEGLRALVGAPLPRLAALDLSRNSITDAGLLCLAAAPLLGRLAVLDLSANVLSDAGVQVLALSPYLGRLSALDLRGNFLGAGSALALARFPGACGPAGAPGGR